MNSFYDWVGLLGGGRERERERVIHAPRGVITLPLTNAILCFIVVVIHVSEFVLLIGLHHESQTANVWLAKWVSNYFPADLTTATLCRCLVCVFTTTLTSPRRTGTVSENSMTVSRSKTLSRSAVSDWASSQCSIWQVGRLSHVFDLTTFIEWTTCLI